jgi:phi13 family phage major tail protein
MSAAGRVCTGFSKPYIANYVNTNGTISYTGVTELARGVDVKISPETGSDNIFYANNTEAEIDSGTFTGGTLTLTVDGLLATAEAKLSGLPAVSNDWYAYDDDQDAGYFGFGFIARYMSDGVTSYVPYVLAKVAFDPLDTEASTQEENISWQTQAITGRILRADDTKRSWKYVGVEYSTEAAAVTALTAKLA